MRNFFVFALLLAVASSKVLLEIEFDIAAVKEEQESNGQSVSQILTAYLQDPNLNWLRYLNTLLDGTPGKTPSRIAFMEFNGIKEWGEFEKNQKGPSHVLFDIFWLPWRRLPWISNDEDPQVAQVTRQEGKEGFLFSFKYSVQGSKIKQFQDLKRSKLQATLTELQKSTDFVDRDSYVDKIFQNEFTDLVIYEFSSIEALINEVYQAGNIFELLPEAQALMDDYAATIYQPPYEKGGNILQGEQFRGQQAQGKANP